MARTINAASVKRMEIFLIDADSIVVDPKENGRAFSEPLTDPKFIDLMENIKTNGQLNPVEVRPIADQKVKLVFGYRRLKAIMKLNQDRPGEQLAVKCMLTQCTEEEALIRNIAENILHRDASEVDTAHNIRRLRDNFGKTLEEIAAIYHKTASWATQQLQLCQLSADLQRKVHDGVITRDSALLLLNLPEPAREVVATPAPAKGGRKPKVKSADVRKAVRKMAPEKAVSRTVKEIKEAIDTLTGPGEEKAVREIARALLKFIAGEIDEEKLAAAIRVASK